MQNKILGLTTSEIQEVFDVGITRHDTLPRALREGYKVLVFSTREKLAPSDDWWVKLVGRENVFLCDPRKNDWEEYDYASGWKKGFAKLGISWPTENGEPVCWTHAQVFLSRETAICTGADIRSTWYED